jgi:transcriptional regulator with XRE-family HTH domain
MPEEETLGQRIKRIRHQRGMSLAKVVRDDFSRAFLNQVELGKARPSIRVLRVIAERLGTEVEYLLEGQEAGIERELALERGRVLVARGEHRRALLALKPAISSYDWPLGSDARVCQAQALIALDRKQEAMAILEQERKVIELHTDSHRLERLRVVERGGRFHFQGDPIETHLHLADRATRKGTNYDELEHFRAARVLLEASALHPAASAHLPMNGEENGGPKVPTET